MFINALSSSTKCNVNKSHTNIYKSVHKSFFVKTKIEEKNDKLLINRTIFWYDSKQKTFRRRKEVQSFDCEDIDDENCNVHEIIENDTDH
jgi:hypothetical protein